jgi:zinc protease
MPTLYQDVVLERQIVDSLEPSYNDHRDPYLFGVLLRVKQDKDLDTVERAVTKQVATLAGGQVDAERLAAVRSNVKYAAIMHLDTADRLALTLAVTTAPTGDLEFMNRLYSTIDSVTPADLVSFAKSYLGEAGRTTVTLTSKRTAALGGAQ